MALVPAALLGIFWIVLLLGSITLLVFFILTLVTAMNILEQCRRRNREMEPGMVWLSLVPAFGMVWIYFVVVRVEQALRLEYRDRDLRRPKDFGQPLGIAAAVCWHAGIPLLCVFLIGSIGYVAAVVLFILYWQRLNKHLAELRRSGRDRGGESGDRYDGEDDYDDRPRRRSRRDEDEEEYEDDRPRRRSRRDEEDDGDEDDRPRRRRADDDEPPRRPTPPDDEAGWRK